jgi:catalase
VAFCPSHVVPGIDFSNDPLLQGRLFSYLDTQISRLGSHNFHEIPINQPKCPINNFQRDGHMRTTVPTGRVAYEPNSLDRKGPREDHKTGFNSARVPESGDKLRIRPESFADHFTQARMFWKSMTETEKRHIVGGFAFELGKVKTVAIRQRMLGQLNNVAVELADRVAEKLGMEGQAEKIKPAVAARENVKPSEALSQLAKAPESIEGRKVGILVTDGVDEKLVASLKKQLKAEGALLEIVAPKVGGVMTKAQKRMEVDHALAGAPSVLFDAIVVAPSSDGVVDLVQVAAAVDWVRDAFAHLKVIGFTTEGAGLLDAAGVAQDAGVVAIANEGFEAYVAAAKKHRIWDREPGLRH